VDTAVTQGYAAPVPGWAPKQDSQSQTASTPVVVSTLGALGTAVALVVGAGGTEVEPRVAVNCGMGEC
jgi:hypothetical protein